MDLSAPLLHIKLDLLKYDILRKEIDQGMNTQIKEMIRKFICICLSSYKGQKKPVSYEGL